MYFTFTYFWEKKLQIKSSWYIFRTLKNNEKVQIICIHSLIQIVLIID